MEMGQTMERLLAKIDGNQAKVNANAKDMLARMDAEREERIQEISAGQEHLKEDMKGQMASLISWIEDNNEKFSVLQGTLLS
jgi:seryl-tRNA synthetase